jgi:hypothetical protein
MQTQLIPKMTNPIMVMEEPTKISIGHIAKNIWSYDNKFIVLKNAWMSLFVLHT